MLFLALTVVLLFCYIGAVTFAPPVQAAPSDPVPECEAINTATVNANAVIVVFRCAPDEGYPYLLNSMGFMILEE